MEEIGTAEKYSQWMAFLELEGWGREEREDYWTGQQMSMMAELVTGKHQPWHQFCTPRYGFRDETFSQAEDRFASYEPHAVADPDADAALVQAKLDYYFEVATRSNMGDNRDGG